MIIKWYNWPLCNFHEFVMTRLNSPLFLWYLNVCFCSWHEPIDAHVHHHCFSVRYSPLSPWENDLLRIVTHLRQPLLNFCLSWGRVGLYVLIRPTFKGPKIRHAWNWIRMKLRIESFLDWGFHPLFLMNMNFSPFV